mmetsp:Transcript_39449/g.91519  ORF Transcript_39449/g.91519 Transcript_39449/m.91519 type:complete len:206 (-) Transcript_39449:181-798(-)
MTFMSTAETTSSCTCGVKPSNSFSARSNTSLTPSSCWAARSWSTAAHVAWNCGKRSKLKRAIRNTSRTHSGSSMASASIFLTFLESCSTNTGTKWESNGSRQAPEERSWLMMPSMLPASEHQGKPVQGWLAVPDWPADEGWPAAGWPAGGGPAARWLPPLAFAAAAGPDFFTASSSFRVVASLLRKAKSGNVAWLRRHKSPSSSR